MSALILVKEIMTKLNLLQLVVTSMAYFDIFMYKILRLSFSVRTVSFYNLSGKFQKQTAILTLGRNVNIIARTIIKLYFSLCQVF